jgi:hypothetical protein
MFLLTLLFPALVHAQALSEPLRQSTPEFSAFYFKRFDRWFEANVHDFKKSLPAKEVSLFDDLLASQKSLVEKTPNGIFRSVTYGVRFDLKSTLEKTVTLIDFSGSLEKRVLDIARVHGVKPPAAKAYGLRWSSKNAVELVSFDGEKLTFTDAKGPRETLAPAKVPGDGCPGVFKDGPVDAFTTPDGVSHLVYSTEQIETEAFGPAGRDVDAKFRKGLNLSPGQVRCTSVSDTEFYYP